MYRPPSFFFGPSVFFEILLSLDRLICNRIGPLLLLPLLFYKYYVKDFPSSQVPVALTILVCYVFVNCTRVATGSAGNATGNLQLIAWFWLLLPFSCVGLLHMVAWQPLVLVYDRVYVGVGFLLSALELTWSFVLLISSNRLPPYGQDHLTSQRAVL